MNNMNVIIDHSELINEELSEYVSTFNPIYKKGYVKEYYNDYDKQNINPSQLLINKIIKILKKYEPNRNFMYLMCRLNRVGKDTNPNDEYHTDLDSGNIILLHYPNCNEPFEGGEFEWLNSNNESTLVNVSNSMNIILIDNPRHRVKNVTNGIRYSFAFFFHTLENKEMI